jgi:hypothetical protein
MTYRIAFPILALLAASGCSGRDVTSPVSQTPSASASVSVGGSRQADDAKGGENSGRSGALHLIKDCRGTYNLAAFDYCTITASNIKQIKLGSRVVYQTAAAFPLLNSKVILYPPGSRNNVAFGRCALDFRSLLGHCEYAGGTGKFKTFSANVTVTCVDGICALDGTYSFGKNDDED